MDDRARIGREGGGGEHAKLAALILETGLIPSGATVCLGILRRARRYGAERLEASAIAYETSAPFLWIDPVDPAAQADRRP
jgi:hypothetical protein